MGADVYLNSKYKACQEKWKPVFDKLVNERDSNTRNGVVQHSDLLQEKIEEVYNNMYAEGYFRDSYNSSSLFWVLGLSWWDLGEKLLNKQNTLSISKAKRLLARFETGNCQLTDAAFNAWVEKQLAEDNNCFTGQEASSVPDARKYFERKHAAWVAILKQSIALNEPLYWSV